MSSFRTSSILALLLLGISLLAPYLTPNDPYETNAAFKKAVPDQQYPLGTDKLGRCILPKVLMGARISIFSSLF
jgi:peptide/nickel transport system permease protein